MARRRKNNDHWAFDLAKIVMILVVAGMFIPGCKQVLIAAGMYFFIAAVLIVVLVGGFFLVRKLTQEQTSEPLWVRTEVTIPNTTETLQPSPAPNPGLVEKLRTIDWFQFEKVVAVVYRKQGFQVVRSGGANPDGGIDLVLEKDGQQIAVQCKQWKTWNVGVKPVREFLGALTDAKIQRGIFVTLCGYSGEAQKLAEKHGIEIVNETGLAKLLEGNDARFDPELIEALNDTRKFCPKCEREMVLRTARKGMSAGNQFWGCSAYPRCRFTMPMNT